MRETTLVFAILTAASMICCTRAQQMRGRIIRTPLQEEAEFWERELGSSSSDSKSSGGSKKGKNKRARQLLELHDEAEFWERELGSSSSDSKSSGGSKKGSKKSTRRVRRR